MGGRTGAWPSNIIWKWKEERVKDRERGNWKEESASGWTALGCPGLSRAAQLIHATMEMYLKVAHLHKGFFRGTHVRNIASSQDTLRCLSPLPRFAVGFMMQSEKGERISHSNTFHNYQFPISPAAWQHRLRRRLHLRRNCIETGIGIGLGN